MPAAKERSRRSREDHGLEPGTIIPPLAKECTHGVLTRTHVICYLWLGTETYCLLPAAPPPVNLIESCWTGCGVLFLRGENRKELTAVLYGPACRPVSLKNLLSL